VMVTAAARNPLVLVMCEAYDRARPRRCQHHSYHGAHSHSPHPLPVAEYPPSHKPWAHPARPWPPRLCHGRGSATEQGGACTGEAATARGGGRGSATTRMLATYG